jgi:non-ribosomal peptide synthetase component F
MDTTIAKLLSNQAKLNPDKIAIKHNGRSITYYDIEVSSNQVASYFIANHIEGDDIVAVAMDRSIKMIVCLWGIIKAGAAYLPIDPNLPSERVDYILRIVALRFYAQPLPMRQNTRILPTSIYLMTSG